MSTERTFADDLPNLAACNAVLPDLFEDLQRRIAKAKCVHRIKSLTLKLRFTSFDTTTVANAGQKIAFETYLSLLETAWLRQEKPVRLIGLGVQLREDENQIKPTCSQTILPMTTSQAERPNLGRSLGQTRRIQPAN